MQRGRLGCVLDRRGGHQAGPGAQGVGRVAMAGGDAFDPARVPRDQAIESRHIAPPCGTSASMPGVVEHGGGFRRRSPARRRCRSGARSRTACPAPSAASTPAKPEADELGDPFRHRAPRLRQRAAAARTGRPGDRPTGSTRSCRREAASPTRSSSRAAAAERAAHAREHRVLLAHVRCSAARRGCTTVSDSGNGDAAHVAADELGGVAERASRARATSRWHQLDAGDAHLRPAAPPSLKGQRPRRAASPQALEQARQQALAAADVEHARASARSGPSTSRCRNTGSQPQLAAREVPARTCRPADTARSPASMQRAPRRRCQRAGHGDAVAMTPSARRQALRQASPARRPAASSALLAARGSTLEHAPAVRPRCARAWPSCSSRMSPAARPLVRRASTAPGSRATVSKPRRVQLTSCRPSRCSTGASNGLRSPAGARKKRGALAGESASRAAAPRRSRARSRAGRAARRCARWRCAVVLHAVAAAHDLAAQLRDGARACCGDAEEGGARAVRIEQVEHRGRDLGSGPSSIVIATSPRACRRVGQARRSCGPSQVERGQRPAPVSSAWFGATAPSAHGHARGSAAQRDVDAGWPRRLDSGSWRRGVAEAVAERASTPGADFRHVPQARVDAPADEGRRQQRGRAACRARRPRRPPAAPGCSSVASRPNEITVGQVGEEQRRQRVARRPRRAWRRWSKNSA